MMEKTGVAFAVCFVSVMGTGVATGGDIYVSAASGDDAFPNTGGFSDPFATISKGAYEASAGDTVYVFEGTYDQAHESSTPFGGGFPIDLSDGITVRSYEEDSEDWARIGGDVDTDTAEALFRIELSTGGTWSDIHLNNLYFEGEGTAMKDTPSALCVRLTNDSILESSSFSNNICERPVMKSPPTDDVPTVLLEISEGQLGHVSNGYFSISDNVIGASSVGGIQVRSIKDTGATEDSSVNVTIVDNTISVEGDEDAAFGIYLGGRFGAPSLTWRATVNGNKVDSSGSNANHGIETGIEIDVDATGSAGMQFTFGANSIRQNKILDCLGDGVWIRLDEEDEFVTAYYASKEVMNNQITGCGLAGIHLDWGTWPSTPEGSRYLHVDTYGNLLVGNGYGIWFENFESFEESMGVNSLTNDTIAFNTVGIQLDGNNAAENAPNDIQNVIVWDNGAQYVHNYTAGSPWDPETDGNLENSDWEGLLGDNCTSPDGNGNIDCDPDFIGNYDLDTGSPCIDTGENDHGTEAVAPQYDLDGDVRKVDGDWDCTSREEKVVDMGAQEAENDC